MSALDRLVPFPRLVELDHVDVGAPATEVWEKVRHCDLARLPLIRALFAIRTLPSRSSKKVPPSVRLDDMVSSAERPGFQVLVDIPPHEVAVGAIGKVWRLDLPFVHVADASRYCRFAEPDFAKVAWAIRIVPRGEHATRVEFELRIDATDEGSWHKLRWYYRLIRPVSRYIRRATLAGLVREFGPPATNRRPQRPSVAQRDRRSPRDIAHAHCTPAYPGDDLVVAPPWTWTHCVEIDALPKEIWPHMAEVCACGRHALREGHELSLHPAAPSMRVVDVEPGRWFIGHALADLQDRAGAKPWVEASWLFEIVPLGPSRCRLVSRYRSVCSDDFAARFPSGPTSVEPIGFAMDRRMLDGVKQRTERTFRAAGGVGTSRASHPAEYSVVLGNGSRVA